MENNRRMEELRLRVWTDESDRAGLWVVWCLVNLYSPINAYLIKCLQSCLLISPYDLQPILFVSVRHTLSLTEFEPTLVAWHTTLSIGLYCTHPHSLPSGPCKKTSAFLCLADRCRFVAPMPNWMLRNGPDLSVIWWGGVFIRDWLGVSLSMILLLSFSWSAMLE